MGATGTSSQKPGRKWGISTLIADAEILEDPRRAVSGSIFVCAEDQEKAAPPGAICASESAIPEPVAQPAALALYAIWRSISDKSDLHDECAKPGSVASDHSRSITGHRGRRRGKTRIQIFKRDYLRPAIAEVNAVTNIFVELIEHREGRRVAEIHSGSRSGNNRCSRSTNTRTCSIARSSIAW